MKLSILSHVFKLKQFTQVNSPINMAIVVLDYNFEITLQESNSKSPFEDDSASILESLSKPLFIVFSPETQTTGFILVSKMCLLQRTQEKQPR